MDVIADSPSTNTTRLRRRPDTSRLWQAFLRRPNDARRNRLVVSYQYLARGIVRRFAARLPKTVDRGDLLTAANVGLMSAIQSFDPTRRVHFEAFGEMRIRGALLDELRKQDWLPRPWRRRFECQKRVVERLRSELGREPYDEEAAQALEMTLDEYGGLFGVGLPGAPAGSMPASDGSPERTNDLEVLEDPRHAEPGAQLTRVELLRLVAQRLSEQECRIVHLKYWEDLPMREIGELTHLSESQVCKIHSRLIHRLKDRLRDK